MKCWSFHRIADGSLLSRTYEAANARYLAQNTPRGCRAINGRYDYLSQRFDLATGQVVDYVPPAPDSDHEWNAQRKRWRKRADAAQREQRRAQALSAITELEAKQVRRVVELLAETDPQLKAIDDQIAALRADL